MAKAIGRYLTRKLLLSLIFWNTLYITGEEPPLPSSCHVCRTLKAMHQSLPSKISEVKSSSVSRTRIKRSKDNTATDLSTGGGVSGKTMEEEEETEALESDERKEVIGSGTVHISDYNGNDGPGTEIASTAEPGVEDIAQGEFPGTEVYPTQEHPVWTEEAYHDNVQSTAGRNETIFTTTQHKDKTENLVYPGEEAQMDSESVTETHLEKELSEDGTGRARDYMLDRTVSDSTSRTKPPSQSQPKTEYGPPNSEPGDAVEERSSSSTSEQEGKSMHVDPESQPDSQGNIGDNSELKTTVDTAGKDAEAETSIIEAKSEDMSESDIEPTGEPESAETRESVFGPKSVGEMWPRHKADEEAINTTTGEPESQSDRHIRGEKALSEAQVATGSVTEKEAEPSNVFEPESSAFSESESEAGSESEAEHESEPEGIPEYEEPVLIGFAIAFILVALLVVVGNYCLIHIILIRAQMRTRTSNIYLLSLLVARTCIGLFVVPGRVTIMFSEHYMGKTFCKLCHYVANGSQATTVLCIVTMAIVRLREVKRAREYGKWSVRRNCLTVLGVWTLGFAYSVRALWTTSLILITTPTSSIWLCISDPAYTLYDKYFVLLDLIVLLVVPIIIITPCYFLVISQLNRDRLNSKQTAEDKRLSKRNLQSIKMTVCLTVLFVVCSSPPLSLSVYLAWGGMFEGIEIVEAVFHIVSYSNAWINVIVFVYFRLDLREAFIEDIRRLIGRTRKVDAMFHSHSTGDIKLQIANGITAKNVTTGTNREMKEAFEKSAPP